MEIGLKWMGVQGEIRTACDELDKPKQGPVVMIPASQLARVLVGIPHMQTTCQQLARTLPSASLWSSPQTIDSILHEMWWLFTYPLQENSDAMKCQAFIEYNLRLPGSTEQIKQWKDKQNKSMGNFDVWVWPKWPGSGVILALLYNGWLCNWLVVL